MIQTLSAGDQKALLDLLDAAQSLRMPKKQHAGLMKVRDDVRRNEVNTQRLAHHWPVLTNIVIYFRSMAARTIRWQVIPRWQRVLFLPALFTYVAVVLPARRRTEAKMNNIVRILQSLKEIKP